MKAVTAIMCAASLLVLASGGCHGARRAESALHSRQSEAESAEAEALSRRRVEAGEASLRLRTGFVEIENPVVEIAGAEGAACVRGTLLKLGMAEKEAAAGSLEASAADSLAMTSASTRDAASSATLASKEEAPSGAVRSGLWGTLWGVITGLGVALWLWLRRPRSHG